MHEPTLSLTGRRRLPTGIIIVAAWLVAYGPRPLMLGLYNDDWQILVEPHRATAPFSAERLAHYLHVYGNRPGAGVSTFVLSSVCGESAALWHTAAAVVMLGVGFALRAMLRGLLRLMQSDRRWPADAAVALWLLFPWLLGFTAWPTMVGCAASPLFFALAASALFSEWADGRPRAFRSAAFFLVSILTYEAFYFQFVPVFLIGWWLGVQRRVGRRRFYLALGYWTLAQGLAIAWNRAAPLIVDVAQSKQFRLADVVNQLQHAPAWLDHLVRSQQLSWVHLALLGMSASALAYGFVMLLRALYRDPGQREVAGLLALCLVGVTVGVGVLAIAGYRVQWTGQGGRTTVGISIWLAAGVAVASAGVTYTPAKRRAAALVCAAVGVLLALATHDALRDWARVHSIQEHIVESIPAETFRSATPGAAIVAVASRRCGGVLLLNYELAAFLRCSVPEAAAWQVQFVRDHEDWETAWDGRRITQRRVVDGRRIRDVEAAEVWIWDLRAGRVVHVARPFADAQGAAEPPRLVEFPRDGCAAP